MVFEMVDGRRVEVPEGRIVVAWANPDYEATEPYKVFEQAVPPEEDICAYYVFDTPEEFVNKWYEMVENPDGMWYWVMDGDDCFLSGPCDPMDIDIFREHWVLLEESLDDFLSGIQVVSLLTEEQRSEAVQLLSNRTYLDMEKGQLDLVTAYEIEQYKPKLDKLFEIGWPNGRISDMIHDWWSDYRMADDTEVALYEYVEQKSKEISQGKVSDKDPQAVEVMMRFKEQTVAEMRSEEAGSKKNGRENNSGFLQLKKIKEFGEKILEYCHEIDLCNSMISALDEDLAVDMYQDTQPGGGNCAWENRESKKAYEERLAGLSGESVFGALYQAANAGERLVLDALLEAFSDQYANSVFDEINPAYQTVKFMECVCDLDYAEKNFTTEDVAVLIKGGEYFRALVENSWDMDKEDFTFIPNVDTAEDFLVESELLKRSSLSVDELVADAGARAQERRVQREVDDLIK